MRLLLSHAFFLDEDPKEQQIMRPYPPLGLLYLSSYLRSRGHEIDIYDSTFRSRDGLFRILDEGPPALLGLYVNLLTRPAALAIIQRARTAGWTVVLGGPEPANYADRYLAAGAHYVVTGEGELVLERLLSGERPAQRILNGPQIPSLDSLPWPDRERIEIGRYLSAWREHHGLGSISLITARGCPYRCRWCSHSTFGNTHRRRSVEDVAAEAHWIAERYSPEMFWYADDVFTIHPSWTLRYAAELKRRGLHMPFECITRADRLSAPIADALAEMGCFRLWIGSESGSQRILDAMERGVRVERVQQAIALAQSRGIATGMFLMWGYEGEQLEDIEATVRHVEACNPDVFLTTVAYPLKGTGFHDDVQDRLAPLGDWTTITDRDVAIKGRHSRRYYKFADELLRGTMAGDNARVIAARAGLAASAYEVEA